MIRALEAASAPLVLIAVGLAGVWSGIQYGVWEALSPSAGFLPALAGGALCVFGAVIVIVEARSSGPGDRVGLKPDPQSSSGYRVGLKPDPQSSPGYRVGLKPDPHGVGGQHMAAVERAYGWRRLGYVAALLGFALLMEPLGTITSIVLLFLWILAVVERLPWRLVLTVTASASVGTWLLFDWLLKVPLPRGLLV